MSGYRGHMAGAGAFFIGALAIGVGLLAYDPFSQIPFGLSNTAYFLLLAGLCIIFGLWPDVDTNSKAQDWFYRMIIVVYAVLLWNKNYQIAAYFGLFALLPVLGHHRGWTHSRWAMLVVPLPFLLVPYLVYPNAPLIGLPMYLASVVGYTSHLFFDKELFKR